MEKRFALLLFGLVLSIGTAFGQTKINGTVFSQDDGEPIIGASVKSGKTKCGGPIKRNVIFSSKTKCNKIKTHTAQNRSI